MGDCGREVAWVELSRKNVEGVGVCAEVADVEDGLRIRQIKSSKVGIEASIGRAEVGYCRGHGSE